jgi:hypothetical protein
MRPLTRSCHSLDLEGGFYRGFCRRNGRFRQRPAGALRAPARLPRPALATRSARCLPQLLAEEARGRRVRHRGTVVPAGLDCRGCEGWRTQAGIARLFGGLVRSRSGDPPRSPATSSGGGIHTIQSEKGWDATPASRPSKNACSARSLWRRSSEAKMRSRERGPP